MIDLRDVTFTIPLRYDTDDRIKIFNATMTFLNTQFATTVIVCEEDTEPRFRGLASRYPNCRYFFEQTDSPLFHRTKLLNQMTLWATTPYIVNYDVDCVMPVNQYQDAVNQLRVGQADVLTGFTSHTWNVPRQLHDRIMHTGDISWLNTYMCICANTADIAMGGIVWWNRQKFIDAGMENENFVSWGPEDQERVYRAQKLGFKYGRVDGTLFHLEHRRLQNSWMNHRLFQQNESEFEKIKAMSEEQLRAYVDSWSWVPRK